MAIFFTASGLVLATSSISTPPSTLAMQRYCRQSGRAGRRSSTLLDARCRGDEHPVDGEPLDLHAEDRPGVLLGLRRAASLTPFALPRPPALTCALTTTVPSFSAAARASAGVSATMPGVTGTPCLAKSPSRLVLHQVHRDLPVLYVEAWPGRTPSARCRPQTRGRGSPSTSPWSQSREPVPATVRSPGTGRVVEPT